MWTRAAWTVDIMRLFQSLNESGMTIVMVTHDEEFARYAKHIYTMQDSAFLTFWMDRE